MRLRGQERLVGATYSREMTRNASDEEEERKERRETRKGERGEAAL